MTTNDDKGPERYTLHEYYPTRNLHAETHYVRADLFDQVKDERDKLLRTVVQRNFDLGIVNQDRCRYLELCEEALSVFDSGPIQFSRDNAETIAKLRKALSPSDSVSSEGEGK